ncbi:MAG: hypothetical protein REI09_11145 [Candidatus Dactylopiibacterium sp.]|nr:hypothetical protein [Candidatus Dactylopiibacterium sp.]
MRIDLRGAEGLDEIKRLLRRAPDLTARAGATVVGRVAKDVEATASKYIADRYNLEAAYVKGRFRLTVQAGSPIAYVSARRRATRLARFDARQLTTAAKSGRRAKGDRLRKISPGTKQAGVSWKVMRNAARTKSRKHFLIPLRAGKVDGGNGMGVFFRYGTQIEQEYGPSIHGAFSWWAKEQRPRIGTRLAQAWAVEARRLLKANGRGG